MSPVPRLYLKGFGRSSILETADKHSAAYRERMHLVSQFLSHKSLPRSLQTRVVRELGLLYKRDHREPVDQSLVLADMTPDLRREVIEHLYAEVGPSISIVWLPRIHSRMFS